MPTANDRTADESAEQVAATSPPATSASVGALTSRLVDLESKLLLLEHDFEALNAAFLERGELIGSLSRSLEKLSEQVANGGDGEEPRSLEENKPPHC